MQLIGMLDSPYVRRVAIALIVAKVPFTHRPISLFRHIDEFSKINPLLKAPTLLTDDGAALMDSNVILDYLASSPSAGGRPDAVESARTTSRAARDRPCPDGDGKGGPAPLRTRVAARRRSGTNRGSTGSWAS